jgi:hypothetical protein
MTDRDTWREYFYTEFKDKSKRAFDRKEDSLKRLYLSFKQEEDYNKR